MGLNDHGAVAGFCRFHASLFWGAGWGWMGGGGNDVHFATIPMNIINMPAIIIIIIIVIIVLRDTNPVKNSTCTSSTCASIVVIIINITIITITRTAFHVCFVSILQSSCRRTVVGWQRQEQELICEKGGRMHNSHSEGSKFPTGASVFRASTHQTLAKTVL